MFREHRQPVVPKDGKPEGFFKIDLEGIIINYGNCLKFTILVSNFGMRPQFEAELDIRGSNRNPVIPFDIFAKIDRPIFVIWCMFPPFHKPGKRIPHFIFG